MKMILKHAFTIDTETSFVLRMPEEAEIVNIGRDTRQPDNGAIWFICDSNKPTLVDRTFIIVGTGWQFPNDTKYLDTIFVGLYAWHVLEIVTP